MKSHSSLFLKSAKNLQIMCNRFHMHMKNTPGRQSTKLPINRKHKFCKSKNSWKPQAYPPNNTHFPHQHPWIKNQHYFEIKQAMNSENKLKTGYQYWPFHSVNQHRQPSNFNPKVYRSCETSTTVEKNPDQNKQQPAELSRSCHCECSCASWALTKESPPESMTPLKAHP